MHRFNMYLHLTVNGEDMTIDNYKTFQDHVCSTPSATC